MSSIAHHLTVANLVAGYGKLPVLHGVSLDIRPSDMVAIIGPNGAGKTTLTRAILGLVTLMDGQIRFAGDLISGMESQKIAARGIGYVPQTRNVFGSLTVQENLDLGANLLERHERADAVERIYEQFPRLKQRRSQRGQSLSGGERQMLAIGSAIISRPKLLILDEPTSGLSPHMTDEVATSIKAINDSGVTVIWIVEENPQLIIDLSDWVYVMDAGTIRTGMPAAELLKTMDMREIFLGAA